MIDASLRNTVRSFVWSLVAVVLALAATIAIAFLLFGPDPQETWIFLK